MHKEESDNKKQEKNSIGNNIIQIHTGVKTPKEKDKEKKNIPKLSSPKKSKKKLIIKNSLEDKDTDIKINNINKSEGPPINSEKNTKKIIDSNIPLVNPIEEKNLDEVQNAVTNLKEKRNWKSWSPQEKILFYEIIANGGNYSSLQKLFKTMNDVSQIIFIEYCFLILICLENRN